MTYHDLFTSHLRFGSAAETSSKEIFILEKNAICIIEDVYYQEHRAPLFIENGIPSLTSLVGYIT